VFACGPLNWKIVITMRIWLDRKSGCRAVGWKWLHWEAFLDTLVFIKVALSFDSAPFLKTVLRRSIFPISRDRVSVFIGLSSSSSIASDRRLSAGF
jgi:hypothetical protein